MAEELNKVYDHIAKAYDLRMKAQLQGSGLCFERLWDVRDIISGEQMQMLAVSGMMLRFTNRAELIDKLIVRIELLEKEVADELADLQRHQREDLVVDKHAMFYASEDLSVREGKLDQVKKRLRVLRTKEVVVKDQSMCS